MRIAACLTGVLAAVLGAVIVAGMIRGLDPNFAGGTAPDKAEIFQELCGAAALVAVFLVFRQLRLLWQRQPVVLRTALTVAASLVLFVLWGLAYVNEYSS